MQLRLLGTSHVSQQSIDEITSVITSWQPDIVAVELDVQRATGLLQEKKSKVKISDILKIGLKGWIFVKIGQFAQQKIGNMVGVAPGSEMKTALLLAKKHKLQVAFIDQPIQITLKNLSKRISWKEKFRFGSDIVKGLFRPRKQMKNLGLKNFDLRKVPEQNIIEKMMLPLKERYPSVYKTLVSDRNTYMVKALIKLMRSFPDKKILCIVGAGHKKGMEKLLLKVEIVR